MLGNERYDIMGMSFYMYLPMFILLVVNEHKRRKRLRRENLKAMKERTRHNRRLTVRFLTCLLSCESQV
jgi:hypothetical protein